MCFRSYSMMNDTNEDEDENMEDNEEDSYVQLNQAQACLSTLSIRQMSQLLPPPLGMALRITKRQRLWTGWETFLTLALTILPP